MKLVTYHTELGLKTGVKTNKGVLPIVYSVEQVLTGGEEMRAELADFVNSAVADESDSQFLHEEALDLAACVPNPGKIICVGLNYRKHAEESNMPIPEYPILFNKFNNSLCGHGDTVPLPETSKQVDYEAELVIVIGKTAKAVTKEEALNYVFGYCAGNDLSARDLQFRTNQWLLGKTCDRFSPLGPYLVTADEVGNPNDLSIRAYLNGELRQDSNTEDMIFHCDEIVSYVSQHMTLEPGDVILTGTPSGVIMGFPKEEQVWLADGDEVTVEIEKVGRLTNRMVKQA